MRKIIIAVVLIAGLAGCSDQPDDEVSVVSTVTRAPALTAASPVPTSVPARVKDIAFVSVLEDRGVTFATDATAIKLGHKVCDRRESGDTTMTVVFSLVGDGYTPEQAGFIVGAAQAAYCPSVK